MGELLGSFFSQMDRASFFRRPREADMRRESLWTRLSDNSLKAVVHDVASSLTENAKSPELHLNTPGCYRTWSNAKNSFISKNMKDISTAESLFYFLFIYFLFILIFCHTTN